MPRGRPRRKPYCVIHGRHMIISKEPREFLPSGHPAFIGRSNPQAAQVDSVRASIDLAGGKHRDGSPPEFWHR
jgi:hypothetical protein